MGGGKVLQRALQRGTNWGGWFWFILCTSDVPPAPVLLFVVECRETMQENYACMYGIIETFCW